MDTNTETPFFIVGAQRSGTTLLRLILNAHPLISIPEEARFMMPFLTRHATSSPITGNRLANAISYLENDPQFRQWNYDREDVLAMLRNRHSISVAELLTILFSSFASFENKPYWGDKSLFFRKIDILAELFPRARFIHLVRDGRDVFHSWRNMDPTKDNVAATALDWNYKLKCIASSFSRLDKDQCFEMRYEDLIEDPSTLIQKLCLFLEVDFHESMLTYYKTSQYYIGDHHSKLIFRKIDSKNKNKWNETLTSSEIRIFEFLSGKYLAKYGYELNNEPPTLIDYTIGLVKLVLGVPYRSYMVARDKFLALLALRRGTAQKKDTGSMPATRN